MESSGIAMLFSSLGSLAVIFAVLFGVAFTLRRLRGRGWQRTSAPSLIGIIASRSLGGQNMLVVVQAGGQHFLIGVSRAGIASIGRLDPHE